MAKILKLAHTHFEVVFNFSPLKSPSETSAALGYLLKVPELNTVQQLKGLHEAQQVPSHD